MTMNEFTQVHMIIVNLLIQIPFVLGKFPWIIVLKITHVLFIFILQLKLYEC